MPTVIRGVRANLLLAITCGCALLAACAPTAPARLPERSGSVEASPSGLVTLTTAWQVFPAGALSKMYSGRGTNQFKYFFNAYLTAIDETGTPQPILVEDIPSLEKRTWIVNPDGTM